MAGSNSLEEAMKAFLAVNPDLPAGTDPAPDNATQPRQKQGRLDIVFEKKGRGGKQATIICGFSGSDEELLSLAATLKRRLATGGSARGGEILLQGDRRREVAALLTELGYRNRII